MRFYDVFFWCTRGSHYVAKETAVLDRMGAPRCPQHKQRLRLRPNTSGERRDRMYPRSRVA
jgi:hypothetical protein